MSDWTTIDVARDDPSTTNNEPVGPIEFSYDPPPKRCPDCGDRHRSDLYGRRCPKCGHERMQRRLEEIGQ